MLLTWLSKAEKQIPPIKSFEVDSELLPILRQFQFPESEILKSAFQIEKIQKNMIWANKFWKHDGAKIKTKVS